MYVPILKAKAGEFDAIKNMDVATFEKINPWFDFSQITTQEFERFKKNKEPPVLSYLNKKCREIKECCGLKSMYFDFPYWPSNSLTESGEHIVSHTYNRLVGLGCKPNPVIDVDNWEDPEYSNVYSSLIIGPSQNICLRWVMTKDAVQDLDDVDYVMDIFNDIITSLNLDISSTEVLIDFRDVSNEKNSIPSIIETSEKAIGILNDIGISGVMLSGCSLPSFVSEAVKEQNSDGLVLRKEMVAWQALMHEKPNRRIKFADFGVRNPSASEVASPNQNGKIRYTKDKEYYVVRGYPITQKEKGAQYYALAQKVLSSPHYMQSNFSWGDKRLVDCADQKFKGRAQDWIAIDTNHHVKLVTQEIEEFLRSLDVVIGRETYLVHS